MYISTNTPVDQVAYLESVIPRNRLDFLETSCRTVLSALPGNVLEVGVYKGGTLLKLAQAVKEICPNHKVYAIDTFSGHPYTDGHPVHPAGKYADVDLLSLHQELTKAGVAPWVHLIQGKIEDVFRNLKSLCFSFAHIDCDLYKPILFCSKHVPPQITSGGLIYFDDYGHDHCPGATKAIESVFPKQQIRPIALPDKTCWSATVQISR